MPEYVRAKEKDTGHKVSVLQSVVDANPDAYQVLKQDAVGVSGDPLPPEFHEASPAAGTTKKESI